MVSQRQKHLLLNAEACTRSERLPECFLMVEAVAAHGLDALVREQRADGELLLRFDAAPRRAAPDAAPLVVRKSAAAVAQALPLHLLACACLPRSGVGWAQEHAPSNMTTASPLEHLRFGLDLLLDLLELAATRKHPRLDEALLRDVAPRRHLFELAHHTCLLVCEVAAVQPAPPASASLLATLPSAAARLMCFAAGGAAAAWPAVAAAVAAAPEGGLRTRALMDAATAALQALSPSSADAGGADAGAAAEAALDAALQLLLERMEGSSLTRVRPALVSHVLTAPPPSVGGAPAGLHAALRLCTAAVVMDCGSARGTRCAARGLAALLALCYCRAASFLDDVFADAELIALATPMLAVAFDLLRARLARPLHAPTPAAAAAHPEPMVADAALQTVTLRLCALLADDKTTRAMTLEALSPALGAALAAEPSAFASRWCGGDEAAARFPAWVAASVRTLVGGTVAEIYRAGWAGGPGEQSALLLSLLATVNCPQPAAPHAREEAGASGLALAVHAAAAAQGGARNAAANVAALLKHVSGNDAAVPQAVLNAADVAHVTQLGAACASFADSQRA